MASPPPQASSPGWLIRSLADVPPTDDWLSAREREVLAGLHSERRRADWRLGRWAGKEAFAARLNGGSPRELEIIAAPSGEPEPLLDGRRVAALSLSHRNGRALAVVADRSVHLGCDLEAAEPRSEAFLRTWLAPAEYAEVIAAGERGRAHLANLIWTAKEAAAKARGEGLRLDVRRAVVTLDREPEDTGLWRPLLVSWEGDAGGVRGWWREEPGWAFAVVSEPAAPPPIRI
jgi:phosphopantetheinyl transferase